MQAKSVSAGMCIHLKPIFFLFLFGIGLNAEAQNTLGRPLPSRTNMYDSNQEQSKSDSIPEKKITVPSRIRAWYVDDFLGETTATPIDTLSLNFQNQAFPERNKTIVSECLGNFGSPFQSKIYSNQTKKTPFLFMRPYDHWITAPNDQLYLNTTTPYTNIKYLTTFGNDVSQEEDFKFLFSVNANKYFNFGMDYEILYARGFYNRNATRDKLANLFGNYQSPRYEAFWKLSYNYLENFENGGITDDRYITQPLQMSGGLQQFESINIPVGLTDAKSQVRDHHLFFNHKYHIGFERTTIKIDSLKQKTEKSKTASVKNDTITEFIPVTSIIHTLDIEKSQKSYRSLSANPTYYNNIANIDDSYTADTASLLQIRNTFGLAMREGFHKWAKFGLTAFMEHDFRRYTGYSPNAALRDSTNLFSRLSSYDKSLLWAGGELSKRQGSVLTYTALARICVLGEDLGDFELSGNLKTNFKIGHHPVSLSAKGSVTNLHPDYFLEHYYSNHLNWDKTFLNENKTSISGLLDIPALGFSASASVENLTNHVYFNNQALPDQYTGSIQVLSFNWKQHLGTGILSWDNDAVYQLSSNQNILPLPDFSVYSNLYIKFLISKVMTTHIGVDCSYHSAYYAPAYMPATGQFYTQQNVKVGNYPLMNIYGNFHLKRMRFFVMYSHLSHFFASPQYFSAPHYPINPAVIKFGLSWNFYD
ncbi:MAG: putative porin [Bacteroidales bacterium]|nr:putative porin [Bacteroidales bacterium]